MNRHGLFQFQLFQQGEQLQLGHEPGRGRAVALPQQVILHLGVNGGIPADGAQLIAQKGGFLPGFQLFAHTGLDVQLVQMLINIGKAAELLHQLPGAFGANARHAGNVVGGIPLNGLDVDELGRGHAVFLPNFVLIVESGLGLAELGGGQAHAHLRGDQLEAVPVAGGDDALIPGVLTGAGQGAQNVVGLPALALYQGVSQIPEQLLEGGHLLGQLRGHPLAVGLIAGIHFMPEGGGFQVKGNGHAVRLGLILDFLEHGEKTVNPVGEKPLLGGEELDPVKGPVDNAVSVQNQQFHGVPPLS